MKHRIQDQRTLDRRICLDLGPASPFEGSWMTPGSDCLRVEPQCQLPTFHQSPVVLRPVANLISEGVVAFAHPLAYQGGERWGWSQISATTPPCGTKTTGQVNLHRRERPILGTVKLSRICAFCGRILLDQRLIINDLAVAAGGENAAKLLNLTVPAG